MASPVPGINPYLENPELWLEVHHPIGSPLFPSKNQPAEFSGTGSE
jgi:hypothetical protein